MKASVCVGDYARSPYILKSLGIRVYCMEELCFALKENAFLLDAELMSESLLTWIDQECGLEELSRELIPMVRKKGTLSAFVAMIMEYVGFYELPEIRQVEQTLKKGAGLNVYERYKARTDNLVMKKKYMTALGEYEEILKEWEKEEAKASAESGKELKAKLLHNKGVVLSRMMRYKEAADSFYLAYEADGSMESFQAYLGAKRMELDESEYIEFAASLNGSLEDSLVLEQRVEQLKREWQEEEEALLLRQRLEWKKCGEKQKYYEEGERLTQALKSGYRSCVGE